MSVHSWCSDLARDEAVRAAEDGRDGPLPTLEECIETARAMMPKSVSSTSAESHENKSRAIVHIDTTDTIDERGGVPDGLRTERVTLEVRQRAESYTLLRDFDWQRILRQAPGGLWPGESVRVVEECCLDRINMGEAQGVCDAVNAEEGFSLSVVPLYAAPVAKSATTPQPPRGWLTEEERDHLQYFADGGMRSFETREVVRSLLARLTPPRVKRPKYFPMSWAHERDDAWIAAIREAGGEVE